MPAEQEAKMDNESKLSGGFSLKLWARLLPFMKPVRGRIIACVLMMLISAGVDACLPLFASYAVNNFVVAGTTEGIGLFSALYVAVIFIQTLTTIIYSRQCMIIEMNTGKLMKHDCFMHLQQLPLSYYNQNSVGYVLARVMSDTSRLGGILAWGAIHMVWNLFYLIGVLAAMFAVNVKMALISLAVLPVMLVLTVIFQPKLLDANRRVRHINSRMTGEFNESINGAKTSKVLVIEESNEKEFFATTSEMEHATVHASKLNAFFMPLIAFLGSFSVALVLYSSGIMVMNDVLSYGVLSAFITYAISILDPVSQMASMFAEAMGAQVNIERITTLLDTPCTVRDTDEVLEKYGDIFNPKTENWPPIKGDITFDHVWFKYDDAPEGDYVLEDIDLHIPAGTTVAIVGETGAGKSTMVNLACRFFEPTKGRVLIDGVDYKERSLLWLHSGLGYVQQTPHLFSGSLMDNIRYGKLDATDEQVYAAAALVSADVVAGKLENGYQTDVGEGGDRLSTGEKQIVSFARALIADPPIFVLDEATSSIDAETEQLVQKAISKVLDGRTSFIIAHRLSTIRSADLILFIEGHGIAESGSHEELMALGGKYYSLYTKMMIDDEAEASGVRLDWGEES